MAKLIDASNGIEAVDISTSMRGMVIKCTHGWRATKYKTKDITKIEPIDEDQYRSLGTSAAGAIIGGALTGGIGLLAGAAIGGRRKKTLTVFIQFSDGNHVTLTETKGTSIKLLEHEIIRHKSQQLTQT